jgi:hypothetical protein
MFELNDAFNREFNSTTDNTSAILSGCALNSMKELSGCRKPDFKAMEEKANPVTEMGPKAVGPVFGVLPALEAFPKVEISRDLLPPKR